MKASPKCLPIASELPALWGWRRVVSIKNRPAISTEPPIPSGGSGETSLRMTECHVDGGLFAPLISRFACVSATARLGRAFGRADIVFFITAITLALAVGIRPASAQESIAFYDFARPGLSWYTIETDHFNIIYHQDADGRGTSRSAQVVARIAEDIYGPITDLYQRKPDTKVAIILKDYEDYSNGAAYFFDNKIEIWAPSLDTPLRGDHNWLRNVITHEFTHIVQVQTTMKMSRRVPFLYFQLLAYENVRRPDVLYGYPNVIVTYPIAGISNPAWLAEGTAQYQRSWLGYDDWDSHRDMLLRTRVLAGEAMSLADMGGFYSHNSLLRETVYNQGHAFTRYLAATYGEDVLRRISEALGEWRNWNVDRAIEEVVGEPAADVYDAWISSLQTSYERETAGITANPVEGRIIEPEGFSNAYPRFSPDGRRLAYTSNRGEDFSATSLYFRDLESGELVQVDLDGWGDAPESVHTCAFGHKLVRAVDRSFGWRPDGKAIVYARRRDSPEGHLIADLYEIDLDTKKKNRLTEGQRATGPAYAPDGQRIVFVRQNDGSTNLHLFDVTTRTVQPVTHFNDGTQVGDAAWSPDGSWIYYARQLGRGRDLYRIRPDGTGDAAVLATPADERSPAFDEAGRLLFASDETGIFNIYRMADGAAPEAITNVVGGAFQPAAHAGKLAYAHYAYDGFKIALMDAVASATAVSAYTSPAVLDKPPLADAPADAPVALNTFDDTDLAPLAPGENPEGLTAKPYRNLFTSFSLFPVVRLDQYVSRRQSTLDVRLADRTFAETLLRNTKVGVLMASREILEGLTLFGGALFSPASRDAESVQDFFSPSRLVKLERDIFLQLDYTKGLPFIPKRWSPQFSLEVYNIKRNVDNGLTVEEFPCTACLPDTTLADLSYNLWETSLKARSKINRFTLAEVGYRYSPYSVTTERFFSKENDAFIDPFTSKYFIGSAVSFRLFAELMQPHAHSDVVPEGVRLELLYEREEGRLLERFDLEDGFLKPIYERYQMHRIVAEGRFNSRLPGRPLGGVHGYGIRARGSTLLGGEVDDFFNDYVGGLIGARGYPFYAMGGNETLWLQAAYHVPILPNIKRQMLFTYVDKLYARVYADAAAAWVGPFPAADQFRKDIGAELRLALGSFYLLPTAIFVSATYGLDAFDFQLDEGFLTPSGENFVRYGEEIQWHFGVLFGFDL